MAIANRLKPHEVKALGILCRKSMGSFERLGAMTGLGQTMIDWLVAFGLAEKGIVNSYTGEEGYRSTKLGAAVHAARMESGKGPGVRLRKERL